jgi:hypothetical protein
MVLGTSSVETHGFYDAFTAVFSRQVVGGYSRHFSQHPMPGLPANAKKLSQNLKNGGPPWWISPKGYIVEHIDVDLRAKFFWHGDI